MKKLLLSLISVFVLINFAFAQSAQQKIDSLKKEQAKQEQALKLANEKLRANSTEQNYQNVVATKKNLEKVNSDLASALEAQKAEAEAKRRKAEEDAKKALEDLYKKKFPEFEYAGVGGKLKTYMLEELKKNPNWDIKDISELVRPRGCDYTDEIGIEKVGVEVKSTSNPRGEKIMLAEIDNLRLTCAKRKKRIDEIFGSIRQAWEWRKNPDKFYEVKKEKREKEEMDRRYASMKSAFKHYYYGYTGMHFEGNVNRCNQINLYRLEIPNNNSYYNIIREMDKYIENKLFGQHCESYYDVRRIKGGEYLIVMCDNSIAYEHSDDIYMQVIQGQESIKEGRNVVYRHTVRDFDGVKCYEKFLTMGAKDLALRYGVYVVPKDSFPKKLVKTFKIEDYM